MGPLLVSVILWPAMLAAAISSTIRRHLRGVFPHSGELLGIVPVTIVKKARSRGCVWLHAVSVGEIAALKPVWEELKRLNAVMPDGVPLKHALPLIVTTCREAEIKAKSMFPDGEIIYAPLDIYPFARRAVNNLRPSLALISETDLWPELLHAFKFNGTATFLINARISAKVARLCRTFPGMAASMFECLDGAYFSAPVDLKRLKPFIGDIPADVTGNVKCDMPPPKRHEIDIMAQKLGITDSDIPLIVAGSTHEGEEELILETMPRLKADFPGLRLILAPRNMERCTEVLELARYKGYVSMLRSCMGNDCDKRDWEVLVLDSIGELAVVYGVARVAFVGGSLVPRDGHNILEPVQAGTFVLFGPHNRNFCDIGREMMRFGAGRMVTGEGLTAAFVDVLNMSGYDARRRIAAFNGASRGAALRTASGIIDDLDR